LRNTGLAEHSLAEYGLADIGESLMAPAKILIVEDETIIAMGIEQSLQEAGYEICGLCNTGEKALDALAALQPDLVLMDIRLAGTLDGVETADRVRKICQLPVVFLTAMNDSSTLKRAKLAEPFGYVIKPCDDYELVAAIEIALARHKAETAIRCALDREKELRDLKSRFVSILSHEFRNPLSSIFLTQELLKIQGRTCTEEKFTNYCDRIGDAVSEMNHLIDEILTIAETEATNFEFCPAPVNLLEFCKLVLENFYGKAGAFHYLHFTYEDYDENRFPLLDTKLLNHILTNLLSNAIKYSPQGGTVILSLRCTNQSIEFQVSDQGIGIPPEAQERLFEAFQRAHNVGTIRGSGLGLAIVKQCVELHRGEIQVFSDMGIGTTFVVRVPLHYSLAQKLGEAQSSV
jgi:signal transduction histidine kinase